MFVIGMLMEFMIDTFWKRVTRLTPMRRPHTVYLLMYLNTFLEKSSTETPGQNTLAIMALETLKVYLVNRGVQYVHWVMHKCIMVKVGGETKYM